MAPKTEAEKALQRKYELLRQRKLQHQQQQKDQAAAAAAAAAASPAPDVDPVRQAAIDALKAKRAAATSKKQPPPKKKKTKGKQAKEKAATNGGGGEGVNAAEDDPEVETAVGGAAEDGDDASGVQQAQAKPASRFKFIIPKRAQSSPVPSDAAGVVVAPKQRNEGSGGGGAVAAAAATPKRPSAVKRAGMPRLGTNGEAAKPSGTPFIPARPELFVGDFPEHFDSEALGAYFSNYGTVVDAQVIGGLCHGFVTFASHEEAAALLEFQEQQQFLVEDGRQLRIMWSRRGTKSAGGAEPRAVAAGEGGPAPARLVAARETAAVVAEQIEEYDMAHVASPPARNLVSYEDL